MLQAAVNFGFGTFIGLALWAIGIPSPILWGTLTAILRFVPYVGAFVSAAFPMALAAMIDPSWWKLIEVAAVFVIGDPLVGQILEPLLFGSQTRLSPLAILLAIAFWTLLWGPIGLVLAVPLTLSIVVMGQHVPRLEFLRVLLGNEPVLEPHEKLYHQLLAGEAQIAAKEADQWIGEHSLVQYLDEVVVPAFRIRFWRPTACRARSRADKRVQGGDRGICRNGAGSNRIQIRARGQLRRIRGRR